MKKICFIISTEAGLKAFLIEHLKAISKNHEISVIVPTDNPFFLKSLDVRATIIPLYISRKINIAADILTLIKLISIIFKSKFDIVHSISPKAGLLAIVASFICRVPFRVHTFTGQIWAAKTGIKRRVFKCLDILIADLATHIIVDSPSQLNFLLTENVLSKRKSHVFNKGSISGVDTFKFRPNKVVKVKIRKSLNIATTDVLFLFLGRLNADKGVLDLAKAFIDANLNHATLLFVGPDEQGMQDGIRDMRGFESNQIKFVGYTSQAQDYMAAADTLCLPSSFN